jgi:hypothetical protein
LTFANTSSVGKAEVKSSHEGQTHISTEYAAPEADPRVSGPDEHEERPTRVEAPPSEGAKAADGQQRVAV